MISGVERQADFDPAMTAYARLVRAVRFIGASARKAHADRKGRLSRYVTTVFATSAPLWARLACSLVLAARRAGPTVVDTTMALEALREWCAGPDTDARVAMPFVVVGPDELHWYANVDEALHEDLTRALFEGAGTLWTTIAPRDLHRAIWRFVEVVSRALVTDRRVEITEDPAEVRSTRDASDYLVKATLARAMGRAPITGNPSLFYLASPRCRRGELLVAALGALRADLALRGRSDDIDDAVLRAFVRSSLRAADDDGRMRSLARLGVWLETGEALSASDLRLAVGTTREFESETRVRPQRTKSFVLADATFAPAHDDVWTLLASAARVEDAVGVLVSVNVATSDEFEGVRMVMDREFDIERPIIEPSVRDAIEEPAALALLARRRLTGSDTSFAWSYRFEGEAPPEARLLQRLGSARPLSAIADVPVPGAKDKTKWPAVIVATKTFPLDARLTMPKEREGYVAIVATAAGWDGFALFALLRSTMARWHHATLARSRGRNESVAMLDVMQIAAPYGCSLTALREAGVRLAAARTDQEARDAVDAIDRLVAKGTGIDDECCALLAEWRSRAPWFEPMIDEVASTEVRPQPAAPPPLAPDFEGASAVSAHNEGAPSVRPTKSNGALGQGSESLLRNRADDGRSAAIPGRKRVTAQPEGDAEREAWAILRAAGSDGLTLGALVRRAREHDED
ncbi:MAG: hypothetical protein JNK05_27925, partial [Myxococcales bacterium]|nr:hypothetical protein [Myxococcales bacterium]